MTRPFDLAVFDFDGTLVQSNAIKDEGFDILAARYAGGPEAMQIARSGPRLDRNATAERFARALGLEPTLAIEIGEAYGDIVDRAVIAAPECPGAIDLLMALKKSTVEVHLSSATPRTSLAKIIASRDWQAFFDGLHGHPATKEETLAKLISQTSTDPARVVVIGDGPDDRDSAIALGTAFIAVGDRLTKEPLVSLDTVREMLGC